MKSRAALKDMLQTTEREQDQNGFKSNLWQFLTLCSANDSVYKVLATCWTLTQGITHLNSFNPMENPMR